MAGIEFVPGFSDNQKGVDAQGSVDVVCLLVARGPGLDLLRMQAPEMSGLGFPTEQLRAP
jgi:hypothetical protein